MGRGSSEELRCEIFFLLFLIPFPSLSFPSASLPMHVFVCALCYSPTDTPSSGFMVFSILDLGYPGSCEYNACLKYNKGRITLQNRLTFGLPDDDDDDEPELGEEAYRDERVGIVAGDARGDVTIASDARAGKTTDDGIIV
jgi:hypothetical protein